MKLLDSFDSRPLRRIDSNRAAALLSFRFVKPVVKLQHGSAFTGNFDASPAGIVAERESVAARRNDYGLYGDFMLGLSHAERCTQCMEI